ncbi:MULTISPECIES: site-specific integrase [Sinorhizobium]|uniref:site-specific integrase n=1 Tax=Sinorhizobium TaxID=28105 RepID=UPI000AF82251|nr:MULTISPECIES: site-specific integrase [Sinorhizobium]WOS67014.1 site-specific integrase [Sinorhizobium fredii GR64]
MTSGENVSGEMATETNWTALCRPKFLKHLRVQGYARGTLRTYERIIGQFCSEIEKRGLNSCKLDGAAVEALRRAVLAKTKESARTYAKFCLTRFIDYLVDTGVASLPEQPAKEPTALDRLREEYDAYLRQQRALSEATIYHCQRFLERFMTFRFGETLADLNAITPDDIIAFLVQLKVGSRPYRDKTPPTHLRNLFKFLFWSGKTKRNLANSVPRMVQPQPANLPRYLRPDEVRRLVEAVRTDDPVGRRNYAMLLLMARLGLRSPEVTAIRLEDIDWRAGEILIRGKGKLHDRMPLPPDVGEAIVDYIRNGRRGESRALFVSSKIPYCPFEDAQILNTILRSAFEKTGLRPPQKYVGSHLLRHSLATDMLRNGASLDEIGDVLRHRSRMTTTIYARHDIEGLRSIARAWPVTGGTR